MCKLYEATKTEVSFEDWMTIVDSCLAAKTGLISEDLPDYSYWEAYEEGVSARRCATRAIVNARECF